MLNDVESYMKKLKIKNDSKLSVYIDENSKFITEVKNLNKISTSFFILVMLDNLIKENIIDKKTIIDMINEIL